MMSPLHGEDPRFESGWAHLSSDVCEPEHIDDNDKKIVGSATSGQGSDVSRFYNLPKHELESMIKFLSNVKKSKYERTKTPKYGTISKDFTEEELKIFFEYCSSKKALIAFQIMAYLGLRVGEVVTIKLTDVDMNKHLIRVNTEKAKTLDELYIHERIRPFLYQWIQTNREEILKHENYILYSTMIGRQNISPNWLRNKFRAVIKHAGLDETYGTSKETDMKRCERTLHRLTTHSLRHYFITRVYRTTKNPIHTQKLARHKEFKSTQIYIHTNKDELTKSMRNTFEDNTEMKEFFDMYKRWKQEK